MWDDEWFCPPTFWMNWISVALDPMLLRFDVLLYINMYIWKCVYTLCCYCFIFSFAKTSFSDEIDRVFAIKMPLHYQKHPFGNWIESNRLIKLKWYSQTCKGNKISINIVI